MQNFVTQYQIDNKSCAINLTSESALKDENMNETIIEGLKAEIQNMEQFLPTTTKDSNNNIKKRRTHELSAVLIQNGNNSITPLLLAPELP